MKKINTKKKIKPKYFIFDVDGVITNGQMVYDQYGKKYKIFGQDDHDSLKLMGKYINILFISGDKAGFKISKKRVEDMGFRIEFVSSNKRVEWIDKNLGLKKCIYMGDGIFDHLVMKKTLYSIAPNGALDHVCKSANYKTKNFPAKRAVAEAVLHTLKKFFAVDFLKMEKFDF